MTSPTSKSSEPGFTLLELLLAITLVGLVLSMSLPRIEAVRDGLRDDEDARAVAVLLSTARDLAISTGTTSAVSIAPADPRTLELRIGEQVAPLGEAPVPSAFLPDGEGTEDVVRRVRVRGRIELLADRDRILFFSDGRSAGGDLLLRGAAQRVQHRFRVVDGPAHVLVEAGRTRR